MIDLGGLKPVQTGVEVPSTIHPEGHLDHDIDHQSHHHLGVVGLGELMEGEMGPHLGHPGHDNITDTTATSGSTQEGGLHGEEKTGLTD